MYLLNIFATASLKLKQKISKNYSSILASVNRRNWLDDLPPLKGGESLQGLFSVAQQVNLLTWVFSPHTPLNFEPQAEQL